MNENHPCRLRNTRGSEHGTCSCFNPKDCPDPPEVTPVGEMLGGMIDDFLDKFPPQMDMDGEVFVPAELPLQMVDPLRITKRIENDETKAQGSG